EACTFGLGAGRKKSKIKAVPHGGNEGRTDAGTDEAAVARAAARAPGPGHRDSPDRRRPLPRSARPHPHEAPQAPPQRPDLLDRETARSRYPRLTGCCKATASYSAGLARHEDRPVVANGGT